MAAIPAYAQYFSSEKPTTQILRSKGRDSVILQSSTPFAVPSISDTLGLVYHEPMPDSLMPRSAIVIGSILVQADESQEVVAEIEKYARKLGADWIVSFQEPRAVLTVDRWKVYRSTALLLRVLDDQFINQNRIEYAYYGQDHLQSYAAVNHWFSIYGKNLGAKLEETESAK